MISKINISSLNNQNTPNFELKNKAKRPSFNGGLGDLLISGVQKCEQHPMLNVSVLDLAGMSMTDKERLDRIDGVHAELMRNRNLAAYHTRKTIGVSMVRSKKRNDMERVMSLYGKDEDKYW